MQFDKLIIRNFMSFAKEEITFPTTGLTLIEGVNHDEGGSNGSGKSTIFDAISWVLFGKTVRGLKDDTVLSRFNKSDCQVYLSLSARGVEYTVERFRSHKDFGNKFHYTKDGEVVELGTLAMTQERLLEDLGIDFELFRCTVLFAQEETFNFVNASNKEQKDILSKVMRIDFADYLDKAKRKHVEAQMQKEELDSKLLVLRSHVDENPEEIYQAELDSWEGEQNTEAKHHRDMIAKHEKQVKTIELKDVSKLEEMRSKLSEKVMQCKKEWRQWCETASNARAEFHSLEKEIASMKALAKSGKCQVCKQEVGDSHSAAYCEGHAAKKEKLKSQELAATTTAELVNEKMVEYGEKADKITAMIIEENRKSDDLAGAKRAIGDHERSLKVIGDRENPWLKKRGEHIEKQGKIKKKVLEMERDEVAIQESLPYLEFWVRAFGDAGIKSFVFDLICSSLTMKTNTHLNTLTSGNVVISFDTQKKLKSGEVREKFDCVVMTDGEREPYESYSGGEKRKISLAVDMALSTIMSEYYGSKFSLVAFDEQTNYMDKQGRDNFMVMLRDVAKDRCVFVIDHDAEFKGSFDQVLTVEKRDGVSRIV